MESTWTLICGNPSVFRERVGGQARGALQQTGLLGPSPAPHWKLWSAQPGSFLSWVLVSHAGAREVGWVHTGELVMGWGGGGRPDSHTPTCRVSFTIGETASSSPTGRVWGVYRPVTNSS